MTTRILFSTLLASAAALLLASCSTTPNKVDSGTIRAKTFNFIDRGATPAPSYIDNREPIHSVIQNSITRTLAAKGVTRQPAGPDVIVAYLVIIGDNATTESINTYFGYGRDSASLQEKAHEAYTSNKNPNYFKGGTLLVDIIDAKNYKLLKRSYVSRPLLNNPTAEVRAERIQEAVDTLFKNITFLP